MKSVIKAKSIIPVINVRDPFIIPNVLSSLYKGGIHIAELTYRNENSSQVLKYAIEKMGSKMTIGAGTVITKEQAEEAISFGAKFIVSPGLSEEVAEVCKAHKIEYIPGIQTATEIMLALKLGYKTLKFFPSEACGGLKTLKALHSAFPQVTFVPTGGINLDNLVTYLKEDFVYAVGGSFMMKGNVSDIQRITKESVVLIKEGLAE